MDNTEARRRVLDAAERLFAQRGYGAVTLRDIGAAAGMHHSSLYHHAPGGKEDLYVEVTERNLRRHRDGLTAAIGDAAPDIRSRLRAVADWLLSQPPLDTVRMAHTDMPAIDPAHARRLSGMGYTHLLAPIEGALREAQGRGEIAHHDLTLIAGSAVLGAIESLYGVVEGELARSRQELAYDLIDTVLVGLQPRERHARSP